MCPPQTDKSRLGYTFRVLNFLAILYLIGIGLMLTIGPASQLIFEVSEALPAPVMRTWPA